MNTNKLLERQIKKYLTEELCRDERIRLFLSAVNNSYNAYEKDQVLSAHAFRINEQEYSDINERLKNEVNIKRLGIKNLKEAIKSIAGEGEYPGSENSEEDNLIDTLEYLKEQIIKRKRMEAELNEYEHRFKTAFEKLGDNVWQHDFLTGKTYFSNTESHFLGYSFSRFDENPGLWWSNILAEDRWILQDNDEKYKKRERDHHSLEYRMINKEGNICWVLDRGVVIEKDEEGFPLKMIGTHTDITHVKQTEVELAQRVRQFQSLSENIPGVIFEYEFRRDGTHGYRYISPTIERIFGITAESFYDFEKFIHPDDKAEIKEKNALSKRKLIPYYNESRLVIPGKDIIWRSVSSSFSYITDTGAIVYSGLMLDITEKKMAEELLRKNEEKYRGIIANMNLGLLEVDVNEHIHYANQSFCEMSGYSCGELLGKDASLLFRNEENKEMFAGKAELRKKKVSDLYEVAVKNKQGQKRWWLISGAPRFNDKGEMIGSIGIHLDITRQKGLEIELTEAKRQAEESSKAKELFLANMSHEIRTPMNGILGMSRQLQKTKLTVKQHTYLDTISSAGENLLVVINDILDISKIEAGKMMIEKIGFRLRDVLTRATLVMQPRVEEKGLELSFSMQEEIQEVLMGDPYRLNQILLNLLSNAVKFTEKGSVRIYCTLTEPPATVPEARGERELSAQRPERQQMICIKVKDTGVGMDEEYLRHLYQKFSQEDRSVARQYGGSGLGMSISKQLTELMGGEISVESRKQEGTEVTLRIPFSCGSENDLPVKDKMITDSSILKGKRILLVEDNEMNRLVATTVLNNYGALVIEAVNGAEGVEMLKCGKFDLVLMDEQMPVMDGLEATRIIRRDIDREIPIIALTANAIKGESERCEAAGMNDYISKPFEEDHLIGLIAGYLTSSKQNPPGGANGVIMSQIKATLLYDLTELKEIGRSSEGFVKKMVQLFLREVPAAVQAMKTAYVRGEFGTIQSTAHRIRPVLGSMKIVDQPKSIRKIEELAEQAVPSSRLEEEISKLESIIGSVVEELSSYS